MDNVTPFLVVGVIFGVTAFAIIRFHQSLDKPGGRDGLGSIGDAFGNLIDVFEPAQARAARDLKAEEHKGPVTPSPDDDDERPVRLVLGPDGKPSAVRIKRVPEA